MCDFELETNLSSWEFTPQVHVTAEQRISDGYLTVISDHLFYLYTDRYKLGWTEVNAPDQSSQIFGAGSFARQGFDMVHSEANAGTTVEKAKRLSLLEADWLRYQQPWSASSNEVELRCDTESWAF